MSSRIDFQTFRTDLASELRNSEGPILFHTDVLRLGFFSDVRGSRELGQRYMEALSSVMETRPYLLPTFNYDYCKTGIYNVAEDRCQVGALNEIYRQNYPEARTLTPVFNYVALNISNREISRSPSKNVFGDDSTFAQLYQLDGEIAFLGAPFHSNTFIHFVEEQAQIGYRYLKNFPGTILTHDRQPIEIDYRVRPMVPGASEYDWARLEAELVERGILKKCPLGRGTMMKFRVRALFDYWSFEIENDELFLLTPQSRHIQKELYKQFGNPLTFRALET